MDYVDGFVLAVPKRKLAAYRKLSDDAGKVWKAHGALEYRECVADDVKSKGLFARAVKLERGEVVVFSWIVYRSRVHRDRVNRKVMKDPRILTVMKEAVPFDVKRMMYGGFKVFVDR
jgi:uncharacterized protein YbaA (DUF1428 family)